MSEYNGQLTYEEDGTRFYSGWVHELAGDCEEYEIASKVAVFAGAVNGDRVQLNTWRDLADAAMDAEAAPRIAELEAKYEAARLAMSRNLKPSQYAPLEKAMRLAKEALRLARLG